MDIAHIVIFVSLIIICIGVGYMVMTRSIPQIAILIPAALGLVLLMANWISQLPTRPHPNQVRAETMFAQNCKQIKFIQANDNTAIGLGIGADGKAMVGAMQSSGEDQYLYECDKGLQYQLNYDIEKYRTQEQTKPNAKEAVS